MFLDLRKTFDTLDHDILLVKLTVSFNFNKSATQWFSSYLTGRSQSVCVNGAISHPEELLYGVPQEGVLGLLLFIMYINELPQVISSCNIELCADDT